MTPPDLPPSVSPKALRPPGSFPPPSPRKPLGYPIVVVLLSVMTIMVAGWLAMMSHDVMQRQTSRVQALNHDLDALGLRSKVPPIKSFSITSREQRPAIIILIFTNGQSVTLNATYRWIYVQLPWAQWSQAVALQREGDRRTRAGESSGFTRQDDGSIDAPPGWRTQGSGPTTIQAWNQPQPDCLYCDRATLADGTTVAIAPNDHQVLIALPLSMLPQVLKLSAAATRAWSPTLF